MTNAATANATAAKPTPTAVSSVSSPVYNAVSSSARSVTVCTVAWGSADSMALCACCGSVPSASSATASVATGLSVACASCAHSLKVPVPTNSCGPMTKYDDGGSASPDRKSTRLNSSHVAISYAVFCLNKKN